MSIEFKPGQEVQAIFLTATSDRPEEKVGMNCDKITVIMEAGQMSGVPWFAVWRNGKVTDKYNGALLSSVMI